MSIASDVSCIVFCIANFLSSYLVIACSKTPSSVMTILLSVVTNSISPWSSYHCTAWTFCDTPVILPTNSGIQDTSHSIRGCPSIEILFSDGTIVSLILLISY